MALPPGARLGPYEIAGLLGAGGMGEVYKARDTRLDRSVAIKVLPAHVSADPERRARFEREAKTIAGLNHPHICTLHDVGEHEGSTFLVMEHLTGETLAQRLEKGPLPLEQVLSVATEIADALGAAHRQGVIHRDLKPGNVMLTKTGAKLLDFGLAKLKGHGEQPAATHLASAPTQSTPLTGEGTIVGTLQYMAPEQVEGKPADARTDLWALGAILYEMLTGKRAFEGTSAASLIGNIMNAEPPPPSTLQPVTPSALDRLVRRCLAKDPDSRWQNAQDAAAELLWLRETSGVGRPTGVSRGRHRRRTLALAAALGLVAACAGAGVMWLLRSTEAFSVGVVRSLLEVGPAEELNSGGRMRWTPRSTRTAFAWTPDGRALVFVGRRGGVQQLYVRRLDATEARPLKGTDGAQAPAVSPDGLSVAFWAGMALKKVLLAGGPVVEIARDIASPPFGLTWDTRGNLYFGRDDRRIWMVSADGALSPLTTVREGELAHMLPWPLPGGQVLLYTVRKREYSWGDEEVVAQTLSTGHREPLLKSAADARYVPTGHLVFLKRGVLFGVAFDAARVKVDGTPEPMLEGVAQALTSPNFFDVTGAGQFAIASTGTLAWVGSPLVPYEGQVFVSVDRHGRVSRLAAPPGSYGISVRLAPGGRELAVTVHSLDDLGLWSYDLSRGVLTPVVQGGELRFPGGIWERPSGRRLAFGWIKDGRSSLAVQALPADGSSLPQVLATGTLFPVSWTPDGRHLAGATGTPGGNLDLFIATIEKEQATIQLLTQTPYTEECPEFSPDGHWLAYVSNVSGREEVWVQAYPGPEPRRMVSTEGGISVAWNPNGRELFFVRLLGVTPKLPGGTPRLHMMAVDFVPGAEPRIGTARELFPFETDLKFACSIARCYDVAPDGQSFYGVQTPTVPPPPAVTHIDLVQNWLEELKAKVPTTK